MKKSEGPHRQTSSPASPVFRTAGHHVGGV